MGYVGARDLYSNYKASECKRTIIRLHCATSKSSLWNMEYVARGGAFERPRIYRVYDLGSNSPVLLQFVCATCIILVAVHSQDSMRLACANAVLAVHCSYFVCSIIAGHMTSDQSDCSKSVQ